MITLDHEVLCSDEQMEFIIEGMRNPMNSWERSDSTWGCYCYDGEMKDCDICNHIAPDDCTWNPNYILGKNDLSLMTRLSKAGRDHRKYMRMIPVMIRITAPLYWWKEFDTYKIGTVANSTSTMHKITSKKFTRKDFSTDMLTARSLELLDGIIDLLNYYRGLYFTGGDDCYSDSDTTIYKPKDKRIWYQLIQMLPDSYNQTRNVFFNYETLANIYQARRNHKLNEWHVVCDWIEALPHSYLITGGEPEQYGKVKAASMYGSYWQSSVDDCVDPRIARAAKVFTKAKLAPSDLEDGRNDNEAKLNSETPESAIRNMTRAEINRNYRLVSSDLLTNKDLEDWKTGKKSVSISFPKDAFAGIPANVIFDKLEEDSDNDKPQRNCDC